MSESSIDNSALWIITRDNAQEDTEGGKGWKDNLSNSFSSLREKAIDPEKLEHEWIKTMRVVGQLIQQAEREAGGKFGMQLDEVTLAVEINSRGQVTLLGACTGEISSKGAITLKFKRSES